jgi:hypothetical protein
VVGGKSEHGSFVYGAYGLLDKISNGLILYFIMVRKQPLPLADKLKKQNSKVFAEQNPFAIRVYSILIPTLAILLAGSIILVGKAQDYKVAPQPQIAGMGTAISMSESESEQDHEPIVRASN